MGGDWDLNTCPLPAYATAASTLSAPVLLRIASGPVAAGNASIGRDFQAAGYPSEHVRGLMAGEVQINGSSIMFEPSAIGDLNTHVISGPRTLDFTEVGLIPYIIAFANDNFRAYSLIPVFPLRIFRHKSIFVHVDGGISKLAN
jgi:4,5-dihydroxyphthalate decarboxylase